MSSSTATLISITARSCMVRRTPENFSMKKRDPAEIKDKGILLTGWVAGWLAG